LLISFTLALLQEAPQIETVRPYVKMACRAESLARVPFYIEKVKLWQLSSLLLSA